MAKKVLRSLIHKYFPTELLMELDKISANYDIDNNAKSKLINKLLDDYNVPYDVLGNGTNRYGILIDGYAVKIALDRLGKVDNRREFKYSAQLQPCVVKVYESNKEGLIAVTEYVTIFTLDDLYERQEEMREILHSISQNFLVGDIGVSANNYINWGIRNDGTACILDFAYIYALSFKQFHCSCSEDSLVEYDNDYNNLICPSCHRKYSFGEIRKRITKADEEAEIGNILDVGYVLKNEEEEVEIDPAKVIVDINDPAKTKKDQKEKKAKIRIEKQPKQNYDLSYEEQLELLNQNNVREEE